MANLLRPKRGGFLPPLCGIMAPSRSFGKQLPRAIGASMEHVMPKGSILRPSPLDDPGNARFAWARYRRIMRWMALVTVGVIAMVWAYLYAIFGLVSIHLYIASALGIGLTVMLTSALMGLVFLSSGTGHDESIDDLLDDDTWK